MTRIFESILAHQSPFLFIRPIRTFFLQADRPGTTGFAFAGMDNTFDQNVERALSSIRTIRETERDAHALNDLSPVVSLSNQQKSSIPFEDIPFVTSVGTDEINLHEGTSLGVGDFAVFGGVVTTQDVNTADFSAFTDSVETLRKRPVGSLQTNNPNVFGYNIDFYAERYSSQTASNVEPTYHGDIFYGNSTNNVILGDYWTSYGYEQAPGGGFLQDSQADAFGQWDNARWTSFAPDTVEVVAGTKVVSQKGQDTVTKSAVTNDKLTAEMSYFSQKLMQENPLTFQFKKDLLGGVIPSAALPSLKVDRCFDPDIASYIPPFVVQDGSSKTIEIPLIVATSASPTTPAPATATATPTTAPPASAPSSVSSTSSNTVSPTQTPVNTGTPSTSTVSPTQTPVNTGSPTQKRVNTAIPTLAPTNAPTTAAPTEGSPGNSGNSNGQGSLRGNGKNKR